MSFNRNVEAHHKLNYSSSVTMVTQQTKDPFAAAVTDITATGEAMSASDIYGQVEYQYGEDKSRRNPENPVEGDRRWLIRPPVIESGQYIDREDQLDGATEPTSTFVTAHTRAVLRGKADRTAGVTKAANKKFYVTEGGILGKAVSGKRPGGAPMPLPSSQYVSVGSTGLTLDKLRDARLQLRKNDFGVEDDDPLFCMIGAEQEDDLLKIAQESAIPLNAFSIEQLKSGRPTSLLGVNWIMTNRTPYKDGTEDVRLNSIFSKHNIVRGVWQDVQGQMWQDTHAKNRPYCYVSAYIDTVRLEDLGVVVIECKQA